MSDYLNNLAARTLNLTPVVQPRVTSLFEPLSVAAGLAGGVLFEGERERADPASTESRFGITDVRRMTSQDDKLRPAMISEPIHRVVDRFVSSDNERYVQEELVEHIVHHPTVTSSAPRFDTSSQGSERDPTNLGWLRTQSHAPYDAHANLTRIAEGETNGDEITPTRGPRIRSIEAEDFDQTGAFGSNRDRVEPDMFHSTQGSRAAIALIRPDSVSITPKRTAFSETPSTGDVPPTISVTIGRVDVRAIFSQPSAPRSSRARQPAAMSLEEYLKQRSEGRR